MRRACGPGRDHRLSPARKVTRHRGGTSGGARTRRSGAISQWRRGGPFLQRADRQRNGALPRRLSQSGHVFAADRRRRLARQQPAHDLDAGAFRGRTNGPLRSGPCHRPRRLRVSSLQCRQTRGGIRFFEPVLRRPPRRAYRDHARRSGRARRLTPRSGGRAKTTGKPSRNARRALAGLGHSSRG